MSFIYSIVQLTWEHPVTLAVFLALVVNLKGIFSFILLQIVLDKGGYLPKNLADFPVCETSTEAYLKSKEKVESFINRVLEDEEVEVCLNSSDINNIHLKGIEINKYRINPLSIFHHPIIPKHKNIYFYFDIQASGILQKRIEYPVIEGRNGVRTDTKLISFERINSCPRVRRKYIESNGRDLKNFYNRKYNLLFLVSENYDVLESSLSSSNFLFYLFGITDSPNDNPERCKDGANYKRVLEVIRKIQYLEIVDRMLVIKAGRNCKCDRPLS